MMEIKNYIILLTWIQKNMYFLILVEWLIYTISLTAIEKFLIPIVYTNTFLNNKLILNLFIIIEKKGIYLYIITIIIIIINKKGDMIQMATLPKAPVKRIIENAGAARVSDEATIALANVLEDVAADIAERAIKLAKHAGRKTIKAEDIELAV